jgi:hypothetical protein
LAAFGFDREEVNPRTPNMRTQTYVNTPASSNHRHTTRRFQGGDRKERNMRKLAILTLAIVLMMATGASAATSPILDFDLKEGSGAAVVDSANGVVGTAYGTVWTTDPDGQPVLYFDNPIRYWFGTGDRVEIPYHAALNSPAMSIEMLVYPMSAGYYTVFAERIRDGGSWQTITLLGLAATGHHTGTQPQFGLSIGGTSRFVVSIRHSALVLEPYRRHLRRRRHESLRQRRTCSH